MAWNSLPEEGQVAHTSQFSELWIQISTCQSRICKWNGMWFCASLVSSYHTSQNRKDPKTGSGRNALNWFLAPLSLSFHLYNLSDDKQHTSTEITAEPNRCTDVDRCRLWIQMWPPLISHPLSLETVLVSATASLLMSMCGELPLTSEEVLLA